MRLEKSLACIVLIVGCGAPLPPKPAELASAKTLNEARAGFQTRIIRQEEPYPVDIPPSAVFDLIEYPSPVGNLAAYVTPDPSDGAQHPAIVWITGGDNNTIGDVWSPQTRDNDQSARAFREAGMVMMFPSQRGGNENPGQREGFFGEVDDVLAATDYLAALDYVDPGQIYLGGHSTGGTMVLLVAECSDRYKAVFALGPVASPLQYGGDYVYCDVNDTMEMSLRAPADWLDSIKSPVYVFEGGNQGNWIAVQMMQTINKNPQVQFYKISGHDHFSLIAPLTELLARQITQGRLNLSEQTLQGL